MELLHVSAECFPVAKVGGLADVAGALPKYQNRLGHTAKLVMPMHRTNFLHQHEWDVVHKGAIGFGNHQLEFTVIKERHNTLQFDLYCIDINGMLDRENVYGYQDDPERFLAFQLSVIEWLKHWNHKPLIIHLHDFHTGLIPFFLKHSYPYRTLSGIKTVFTIHNAQYQGWMNWSYSRFFPEWDEWKAGLIEWNLQINPMAAAIKCADKVNTVSTSYMKELRHHANGLENLFQYEKGKCAGIINGIDYEVWDPHTDPLILQPKEKADSLQFKSINKKELCKEFGFEETKPLIIFIGRLVHDKGADVIPDAVMHALELTKLGFNFLLLGSGDHQIETRLLEAGSQYKGFHNTQLGYNEPLSHRMYAGADFLLMPSRVEPCGLNQLYAMRYGTIPIVRRTGGLNDTVTDWGDGGIGICFNHTNVHDIVHAIERAVHFFQFQQEIQIIRKKMMKINHSWEKSARDYIDLYHSIL